MIGEMLSAIQESLEAFFASHTILAPIVFVLLRAIVVIIPPLPGLVVDLAGIAVLGVTRAFILAEIGVMLGASVAFGIARRYRVWLVSRLPPSRVGQMQKWYTTLSERDQFWSWVALRLPSNIAFDVINYGAGLSPCRWRTFFFSTFIGSLPGMLVFFYVGDQALKSGVVRGTLMLAALAVIGTIVGNRYLQKFLDRERDARNEPRE